MKKTFVAPRCEEHILDACNALCTSVGGGTTPPFEGDDDYGTLGVDPINQLFGIDGNLFL